MSPDADEMAVAPMDGFVQTTALYMLQVAIEAEATAFLGRGTTAEGRGSGRAGATAMHRRTCIRRLDWCSSPCRSCALHEEQYRSAVVDRLGGCSGDLEALVRGMYVRGLSTRDVGDLYGETFGRSRLSKSMVSRSS